MNTSPHSIPAVSRAIQIIEALAEGRPGVSAAALARELGISQSSCYRILQTLVAARWINVADAGGYDLALGLLPVAEAMLGTQRLVETVRPHLEALAAGTQLTAKLSMRQNTDQVTVARVESPRPLAVTGRVGAHYPVVLGSSGAALLSPAADDEIEALIAGTPAGAWQGESPEDLRTRIADCRRHGACANLGLHPQGIDAVAAPLRTAAGPAAITLLGLRGDFAGERLRDCLAAVRRTARTIETAT